MPHDVFSEKHVDSQEVKLDPKSTAVLVVDMLNEFCQDGGLMVLPGAQVLYPPHNRLLDAAHKTGVQVFWLNQTLRPDDTLFKKRIKHCIIGSWGAQVVEALHKDERDITIPKRRYSGFYGTDLDLHLRSRRIDTLIVTGVVTNICVRSTIHDAFFLGYEVIVPVECVAATNPMAQESSLYDIETHFGVVTNLDAVIPLLKN